MAATGIVRSCSSLHLQLTFEAETLRPFRSVGCSQPLCLCRNIRSLATHEMASLSGENGRPGYFLPDHLRAGTERRWFRYAVAMNLRRPKCWRQKLADIGVHNLKRF